MWFCRFEKPIDLKQLQLIVCFFVANGLFFKVVQGTLFSTRWQLHQNSLCYISRGFVSSLSSHHCWICLSRKIWFSICFISLWVNCGMTLFCRYCRDMHIHNFTKKSLFCWMLRALGAMVVCFTILTPVSLIFCFIEIWMFKTFILASELKNWIHFCVLFYLRFVFQSISLFCLFTCNFF
jgi:hypothetical protein